MTVRFVVRHVRYWRGSIHKWSTVYQFVNTPSKGIDTAACQTLLTADDGMCYGPIQGASGGTYECQAYNQASGGVPIASYTHFDWTTPASWIPYSASGYSSATGQADGTAEVALVVEWPAGLSKSGKPVILRKWYHAVPESTGASNNAQVSPANQAALVTAANNLKLCLSSYGIQLGSATGRLAGNARVLPFYGNHQMPRGRRRKALVTASGKYQGPSINLPESGNAPGENLSVD